MKTKFFLFIFLWHIYPVFSQGQTWFITRGLSTDEVAWAVDVDSSGNIFWAIEQKDQWPFWYYNILLYKIDSTGQQIWQTSSWDNGTGFNDIAFKATVNDSSVFLSGRTDSTGNPVSGDALVLSYNTSNGDVNWKYVYNPVPDYGYEEIDGLIIQPDGIYLSGWTKGQTTDEDFLIQKISLTGILEWTNSWDYAGLGKVDGANGHFAMDNNLIYAAGHVNLLDGSLVCFDRSNGAYLWDVTWSESSNDEVLGLTMGSDSMLYTVGYFATQQYNSQTCIKKFSRTGQLLWTTIWGGTGTEDSRALLTDGDSLLFVAGTTTSYGNGAKEIFVLKLDTSGSIIDSLFWGGAYDEVVEDFAIYGDYLYLTGITKSFGNGQINGTHTADGLLLKINGRTMDAPDTTLSSDKDLNSMNTSDFFVFPNPSNHQVSIQYLGSENATLSIYDMFGREVNVNILRDENSFFIYNLSPGTYFVKIESQDRLICSKLIRTE